MGIILKKLWTDPMLLGSVAMTLIPLAISFGFDWSGDQVALIASFIGILTGASRIAEKETTTLDRLPGTGSGSYRTK